MFLYSNKLELINIIFSIFIIEAHWPWCFSSSSLLSFPLFFLVGTVHGGTVHGGTVHSF